MAGSRWSADSDLDYEDPWWHACERVPCARCGASIHYGRGEPIIPHAVCDSCFTIVQETQRRKAEQETRQRRKGTAA